MIVAGTAAGARRQQHGDRPQPFAAALDDIAGQLVDQHHIGVKLLADQGVDSAQIVRDGRADAFDIHGKRSVAKDARHATDWPRQGQGKRLNIAIGWNLFDLDQGRR